jgi:hypothetical protein
MGALLIAKLNRTRLEGFLFPLKTFWSTSLAREVLNGLRVRGANSLNPTAPDSSGPAVIHDAILWDGKDE